MALRRPFLLFCILTIVLGVSFHVHRPHTFWHVQTDVKAVRGDGVSNFMATFRKEASDSDSSTEYPLPAEGFDVESNIFTRVYLRTLIAEDVDVQIKGRMLNETSETCCGMTWLDEDDIVVNYTTKPCDEVVSNPSWEVEAIGKHRAAQLHHSDCDVQERGSTMTDQRATVTFIPRTPTVHLTPFVTTTLLDSPFEAHSSQVIGRPSLNSAMTSGPNDSHVCPNHKWGHGDQQASSDHSHDKKKSDPQQCGHHTRAAVSTTCCTKHHHCNDIPRGRLSKILLDNSNAEIFLDEPREFQFKTDHIVRRNNASGSKDKCPYFEEQPWGFDNKSFHLKWAHLKAETRSKHEHQLSLVCLCLSLLVFRNEEFKQKVIAPLLGIFRQTTNIRKVIGEFFQRITKTSESKQLSFHHDPDKSPSTDSTEDFKKDNVNFLSNMKDYACVKRPREARETGAEGKPRQADPVMASCLTGFTSPVPGQRAIITVFPASFFPSPGSSAKDTMSHLGCRLASLNSLPASCTVSRVRLAQAGFYYDHSKAHKDGGDQHEMTCHSCGVSYSQWKEGDNPDTIHLQLRPDCLHLKESSSNNSSTSRDMSLMPTSGGSSIASSNASSGYGSLDSARSMSSGSGSSLDSAAQAPATVPDGRQAPAHSTANHAQLPRSAAPWASMAVGYNNGSSDLATDCAAILPSAVTSPPYSTNQSTAPRPARDSVTVPPTNHTSSFGSGYLYIAGAQGLDDRPPVSTTDAVYPQFARMQDRRATFINWPLTDYLHPDDLVMQGFYYAGYADCVRCFYCGVGLKSWCREDDVMTEHIRWRPSCGYVLNTRGRHFVNSIMQRIQASASKDQNSQTNQQNNGATGSCSSSSSSSGSSSSSTGQFAPTHPQSAPTSAPPFTRTTPASSATRRPADHDSSSSHSSGSSALTTASSTSSSTSSASASAGSPSDRNAAVSREVLRVVEEMGFPRQNIERAVQRLQQSGVSPISADALAGAVCEMDIQTDDEGSVGQNAELRTDGPEEDDAAGAGIERAERLADENQRMRERNQCKICHNARVGLIYLPCGHIQACVDCGSRARNCSMCGQFIKATANVYI